MGFSDRTKIRDLQAFARRFQTCDFRRKRCAETSCAQHTNGARGSTWSNPWLLRRHGSRSHHKTACRHKSLAARATEVTTHTGLQAGAESIRGFKAVSIETAGGRDFRYTPA